MSNETLMQLEIQHVAESLHCCVTTHNITMYQNVLFEVHSR